MKGDFWMEPPRSTAWEILLPKNGTFYQIQRKRRIPVTGNVAFIEQWGLWQEFDTKGDRDKELKRLRDKTAWHLRGRTVRYFRGQEVSGDPFEYRDA